MPFLLRAWMVATWALAFSITLLAKRAHHRMGAPMDRFTERLGQSGQTGHEPVIWFHAASLGEVVQIGPIAHLLNNSGDVRLLVTTSTASGADWIARELPFAVHRYVPLDIPAAVTRFLDNWPISIAVFVEGDLWPRLVLQTAKRDIPQVLLNARHSRTRERFPKAFGTLLSSFAAITCRSASVADSFRTLGLRPDRVRVMPDLKAAASRLPAPKELTVTLAAEIGERPLWLAASTHPDDEDAVLDAHLRVVERCPTALLILAPRHPRRGAPLNEMAGRRGLEVARRSLGAALTSSCQVYIVDTLGELGAFFSLAPISFLGGSFGDEGGHNPYEPACFGSAILSGPCTRNFGEAYDALVASGGALQVDAADRLGDAVVEMLVSEKAASMGRKARAFMDASTDSAAEYAELIRDLERRVS